MRYKIHDKFYDLKDFSCIHPGGAEVFKYLESNTNVTPIIYSYHKNPENIINKLSKYEIPLNNTVIKYDTLYTYDKYNELKKLVYSEMHNKKIPFFWSNTEIITNFILICLYFATWAYCFINADELSDWWMVVLSIMFVSFCLLIGHETAHHTGLKNQRYNNIIARILSVPNFSLNHWYYNHNYLHHCFTNTENDSDFSYGKLALRYSPNHKLYFHHKFQFLYIPFICILNGYNQSLRLNLKYLNVDAILFISLLLYTFGFFKVFLLFGSTGFLYTFIVNLSHIQEDCVLNNTEYKNDFLCNQITSSINYKTSFPFSRLICFGLDIQIEHHIFPNIPHSSLRQIKPIVQKYCNENNIKYIEKSSIFSAIYSYIVYIYKMGSKIFLK